VDPSELALCSEVGEALRQRKKDGSRPSHKGQEGPLASAEQYKEGGIDDLPGPRIPVSTVASNTMFGTIRRSEGIKAGQAGKKVAHAVQREGLLRPGS